MGRSFPGVNERGIGPKAMNRDVFESNWVDYVQRSLKNHKARSSKDIWYGRIDEVKAEHAAERIRRGEEPGVVNENSIGAKAMREMRRLGPSGGLGESATSST